jgi:iron(III) transport system permease protein
MNISALSPRIERLLEKILPQSRKILLYVVSLILALLVLPPIGMLLFSSVRSTADRLPFEATSFTINNFINAFTSDLTYRLLLNTAWYAVGSVTLAISLAVVFAWLLERTNVPFRRAMFMMILAPMGMPTVIKSMAWVLLGNPANGLLNMMLRSLLGLEGRGPINIYSIPGMILVTALTFVPMIYIMISGVFSRVDPSYEEAARTSGAGFWVTIRRVSLPLLGPAIFAAAIYYLVIAMETFEVPAVLGMPRRIFVFSTIIYYSIHPMTGFPDYGMASTYGIVLLISAAAFIYMYSRYVQHGERFATVTGRGYRPQLIDLGRWKYVPIVLISGYSFFAVGLPLLILIWTSFVPTYAGVSLSSLPLANLDAYRELLEYSELLVAAKNTLWIATVTGILTMLLVTLSSWLSVRGGLRGSSIPDRLAFIILGIPSVVLSLALIFIYTAVPLPIYGTTWIIVIALMTRSLPFGTRLMTAAFLQIHRELEEAAATSGAGMWNTFWRIVLPLLWPSFTRGFLWAFVRSMRETTAALMLYSAGNQTIAVIIWFLWVEDGEYALASAIAVPLVIITSILTYFVAKKTMLGEEN